jgi:hypothetical protein
MSQEFARSDDSATVKKLFSATFNENQSSLFPFLNINTGDGTTKIPVFSLRQPEHQNIIAKWIASGRAGAVEIGVMGVLKAVSPENDIDTYSGNTFWKVKKGRGPLDKIPVLMPPDDHARIVDYARLHPDFAFLEDPENRRRFFDKYPFHTILPVAPEAEINVDVFVTTPEESRRKYADPDQWTAASTICAFFLGGDCIWEKIAGLVSQLNPAIKIGISSLNDHGEQPPYDFYEFVSYVNLKQRMDYDFVIQDPVIRRSQIRSSFTQIRLPLRGEAPEVLVTRKGSLSTDLLKKHLGGYAIRELSSAKTASHGHSEEVRRIGLDDRVLDYLERAANY